MKFQCGGCDKYFTINTIDLADKDLDFQCDKCGNNFLITKNLAFSSSGENSNIVCENCGKLIPEKNTVCNSCNLVVNKIHEELRIDNKYYEKLEVLENGKVSNANSGKILTKKSALLPVVFAIVALTALSVWYVTKNNTNRGGSDSAARIETQIVIMKSGQTYYADTIEPNGAYIKVTNKDGSTVEVLEKDVFQISKAVLEN